jgi:hypothetical protein
MLKRVINLFKPSETELLVVFLALVSILIGVFIYTNGKLTEENIKLKQQLTNFTPLKVYGDKYGVAVAFTNLDWTNVQTLYINFSPSK